MMPFARFATLALVCALLPSLAAAQPAEPATVAARTAPSLEEQWNTMLKEGSRYQDYRMVKEPVINQYFRTQQDTLAVLRKAVREGEKRIAELERSSAQSLAELETARQTAEALQTEKDQFNLGGLRLGKGTFSALVLALLALLALGNIALYLRFRSRDSLTSKAEKTLRDVQEEYDQFKKRALEREQKLKRELQDELNRRGS
jgi:hypothetical protein